MCYNQEIIPIWNRRALFAAKEKDMSDIHVLSPLVADMIAAGEVV